MFKAVLKTLRVVVALCMVVLPLMLVSCDTHRIEEEGFLAEPGPILFVGSEDPEYAYKGAPLQLYNMEPDGSEVRQLTGDAAPPVLDAVWSPDGRKIALVISEGQIGIVSKAGIYITDADGTGRYRLTGSNAQFLTVFNPVWSPDSKRIAFTAQLPPEGLGWFELFVINLDGSGLHQIRTDGIPMPNRIDGWSSDGQRLLGSLFNPGLRNAEGSHVENGTVITFNLNGVILDTLMQTEGAPDYLEPYAYPQAPLWSNDERRMAFSRRLNYTKTDEEPPLRTVQEDIYVADADGTGAVQLTHGEYFYIFPVAWSPDDSAILARAANPYPSQQPHDPSFTEHLVIVQADGSGLKEITPFHFPKVCLPTSWRK